MNMASVGLLRGVIFDSHELRQLKRKGKLNEKPVCCQCSDRVAVLTISSVCGCRFLEVDGECAINLTDSQLYKLLSGKDCGVKVVILRAPVAKPCNDDDVESLREDLSLALMELDAVQAENKQLTAELDRLSVPSFER